MSRLLLPLCFVSALAGCLAAGGGGDNPDPTGCCVCLLTTDVDGSTSTADVGSDTPLDTNCVHGAAPFADENPQCSTEAATVLVEGAGTISIEDRACAASCATACAGIDLVDPDAPDDNDAGAPGDDAGA